MPTVQVLREENGYLRYRVSYEDGREPEENKYPALGIRQEAREKHKSAASILAQRLGLDEAPETVIEPEPAEVLPTELPQVLRHSHSEFNLPPLPHEHIHEHVQPEHNHPGFADVDHYHPMPDHDHPVYHHEHPPHSHPFERHDHPHEHQPQPHEHPEYLSENLPHSHDELAAAAHEHTKYPPHSHDFIPHDHGEHSHPIGEHDHPLPKHDHQHEHDLPEHSHPPDAHEHNLAHSHEELPKLEAKIVEAQSNLLNHSHQGFALRVHEHAALEESIVRTQESNTRLGIELSKAITSLTEQVSHSHPGMAQKGDIEALQSSVQALVEAVSLIRSQLAATQLETVEQVNKLRAEFAGLATASYAPLVHDHPYYSDSQHHHDVGGQRVWRQVSRQDVNGKDYLTLEPVS